MKCSKEMMIKLLTICERHDLKEVINALNKVEDEDYMVTVAFLGEFNTGKSTLINALIGKKLLPAFNTPTTAVITRLEKGNTEEYFAISKGEDEKYKISKIDKFNLAKEIKDTEKNEMVIVRQNEIDIIDDKTIIIDTPGLSSLNETHSEITYGYLPMADVAIVVLQAENSTVPDSVMEFLNKYPREMLNNFYFVINQIDSDQLKESLDVIRNEVEKELRKVVDNPVIFMTSGERALECKLDNDEDGYRNWGLSALQKTIQEDVPQVLNEVSERRKSDSLTRIAKRLISLLEDVKKYASLNTDKFDNEIDSLRRDIEKLTANLDDFTRDYELIKIEMRKKIEKVVEESLSAIGVKVVKNEPINELLDEMIDEIKSIIETGMTKIRTIKVPEINISEMLKTKLERTGESVKKIADIIADVITFALVAVIIPGNVPVSLEPIEAAGAAATVATQKAGIFGAKSAAIAGTKAAKTAKALKVLGVIGKIIKDINPIERVKGIVVPWIVDVKMQGKIKSDLLERFDDVFDAIKAGIDEVINENYLLPIEEKKEAIRVAKQIKATEQDGFIKKNREVTQDITQLTELIT